VYSALLDGATCAACEPMDGEVTTDLTLAEGWTPNPDCEGGDRCRCLTVYEMRQASEARASMVAPNPASPEDLAPGALWAQREAGRLLGDAAGEEEVQRVASLLSQHPERVVGKLQGINLPTTEKAWSQAVKDAGFSKVQGTRVTAFWSEQMKTISLGPGFDAATFHHEMGHAIEAFTAKAKTDQYFKAFRGNQYFDRHTWYAKTDWHESFAESYSAYLAAGKVAKAADPAFEATFKVLRAVLK